MNQLLVTDLDGTLLRNDKTVSKETVDTLIKFKKNNNKIIFATARPPRDVYKYIPKQLKDNLIICYNGACIVIDKKIIYKKEMTKDTVLKIIEKSNEFGYNQICLEIDDKLYSNFDNSEFFGKVPSILIELKSKDIKPVYKAIICSKTQIKKDFLNILPNACKGVITDNGKLCQIMHKEVSKWNGIQFFIKKYNIKSENIIAFGDDYNDLDMIKNAGIGVAMGNANQFIKESANFVTDTNMNEGIAKFIKNMI